MVYRLGLGDAFIENYKDSINTDNETRDFYRATRAMYLCLNGQYNETLDILPGGNILGQIATTPKLNQIKVQKIIKRIKNLKI